MIGLLLRYVLPALVLTGAVSFGVHKYNDGIRVKAVDAALVKEHAITAPVIKRLGEWVADRDATIAAKDAAFKKEHDRQIEVAKGKQKLYNNLVIQNAKLSKQINTTIPSPQFVADGVRNLIAAGGDSACAADSDDRRRLGAAIAQCEADLNQQHRATEIATDIAVKALAAARALRN